MDIEPETTPAQNNPDKFSLTEASRRSGILFGRFGLRAGWGIAIFLFAVFVFYVAAPYLALFATRQLHVHSSKGVRFVPEFVTVADGFTFAALGLLCWLLSRIEHRRFRVYGIGSNRWKDVFPGALWGLLIMSGLVASLHQMHLLVFDGRALSGATAFFYGARWLLAFLLVGFAEEYIFRGYLQFTLMRGVWGLAERISPANPRPVAFWSAALVLSAIFSFVHGTNPGETHFGLLAVFLAGMLFSYALWRTGSLWWGIGFHMAWDWAQSFLYGVADSGYISVGRLFVTHPSGNPLLSGGSDGPEGSIFVCAALLLTATVVCFTRPGLQPALEQYSPDTATPHEAASA